MPRGLKICPKCGRQTGPRAKNCPNKKCGYKYTFKPSALRKPKGEKIDWRQLQRGDVIKIIMGSGPYWISKYEKDEEGNPLKIPMGYYGKYTVKSIDKEGIHAYPLKAKGSGHCYIYMGKKKIGKSGTHIRSHKIRKLKIRPRGEVKPKPDENILLPPPDVKQEKKKKGPRRVRGGNKIGTNI